MRNIFIVVLLVLLVLLLTGCADTVSLQQAATKEPVGFWYGLWHGVIFAFAWIGSLFSENIAIYAIYNNGGWYDFGYFMGISTVGINIFSIRHFYWN